MLNKHAATLRSMANNGYTVPQYIRDAAAEIDRLNAELAEAKREAEQAKADHNRIGMEVRGEFLPKLAAMEQRNRELCEALKRALSYVDDIANEDTNVKFHVGSATQLAQEIKELLTEEWK